MVQLPTYKKNTTEEFVWTEKLSNIQTVPSNWPNCYHTEKFNLQNYLKANMHPSQERRLLRYLSTMLSHLPLATNLVEVTQSQTADGRFAPNYFWKLAHVAANVGLIFRATFNSFYLHCGGRANLGMVLVSQGCEQVLLFQQTALIWTSWRTC